MSRFAAGLKLRALSLHTKLMLALTMLVALVVAGAAYLQIERERSRGLAELEARASALTALLSRSLAQPLWNVDVKAIDQQLGALSDNAEIAEISVTAINYGSASTVKTDQATETSGAVVRVRPIEYQAPDRSPAEKIGEVKVVLTRSLTDMAIASFRNAILFVAAAIVVTLYVATFVLLKRLVVDPVRCLQEVVERIAGGDLHSRCRVAFGDELGRLAARVNDMADRLVLILRSLQESEGRLERAQRVARVGWWERDCASGHLSFSDVITELYGVDERDRTGEWTQVLRTFLHPDDCSRVIAAAEAAVHGGARFDVEYRVVLRDGRVRVVHSQGDVTRDESGRPLRHFGVAQDITERKQAEHALRRSEHYLAEAQRLSRTGSWALDPATGKTNYWSEEMFRIHGLDPQRSDPPDMDELPRFWHSDERAWVVERIRTTIRDRGEYAAEHRLVLPDGTTKHLRAIGHPLLDASGGLVEYVGTVMDITERKHAEEALQKAQAELAHVTRVTTVNALASSIAHEVNQPLGAVVASAGAALRWLAHDPPELEEAREMLRHIVQDGQRAGEVIGRVRELLRKSDTVKTHLDLNDLINDTVALVHSEASRQRIVLRTVLAPGLPRVEGDPVQLQQVLLNLMLNGIEAMKDVTKRPRELLLRSEAGGSDVVLVSVQDTGVGLDPRSVERVFDAFYTTKAQGLGMGLAICRSILGAHGGRLWASAHEPHGTVFRFTLPLSPS